AGCGRSWYRPMKWVTRRNIHVDRTSCPWLIRKFIDAQAEFIFVGPTAERAALDDVRPMYDALYAYCQAKVQPARGNPRRPGRPHQDDERVCVEIPERSAIDLGMVFTGTQ